MGLNKLVDFTTAKLLKEKGFDKPCTHHLVDDKSIINFGSRRTSKDILENLDEGTKLLAIPTIAEVVMWVYEKYGAWIEVRKYTRNGLRCFSPYIDNTPVKKDVFFNDYDSPTEAYEAAIFYVLSNLI